MTFSSTVLEIMIVSPGDVVAEREAVRDIIEEWNNVYARERNVILLATGWETHSTPELGGRPQQLINDRILVHADLLIGIFKGRLGSDTGKASSGSVEEIEEHRKKDKPVLLYFFEGPIDQKSLDIGQYQALQDFKTWARKEGLNQPFDNLYDFKDKLRQQLPMELAQNTYLSKSVKADTVLDVSLQRDRNTVSKDAVVVLRAAVDGNGVAQIQQSAMGARVIVGGVEFGLGDPRACAKWDASLQELNMLGFLKRQAGPRRGELFVVTESGYRYIETIDNVYEA